MADPESWSSIVPPFLVAALVLFLPGLVVGLAGRLRGAALPGVAPVISVGVIAGSAVVAGPLGMEWSILPVLLATVALAGVALVLSIVLRRWAPMKAPRSDPWPVTLAAWCALPLGLAVAALAFVPGLTRPDAVSQTYDANFHYSAVRQILESHDASSMVLGVIINPGQVGSTFYPGAWHAITSLVVQLGQGDIIVSANAVSLAVAGLVWPATCMVLVRQLLGSRWAPLLAAGALCGAFTALPTRILAFGVLWPNTLGYVLIPAVLAVGLSLLGLARDDAVGRPQALLVAVLALPALGLAHPNAVFALVLLATPAVVFAGASLSVRSWRSGRRAWAVTPWLLVAGVIVAGWVVLGDSPVFERVSTFDWPARMTVAQAAGEVMLLATLDGAAAWILAATVLGGLVIAVRTPRWRWLAAAYLLAGAFYVLAAGSDSNLSATLTGPWYNDAFRLAAILPIAAVPLAVIGLDGLARWAGQRAAAEERAPAALRERLTAPVLLCTAAAVVLVATGAGYASTRSTVLAGSYTMAADQDRSPLLTTQEYDFLRQIPDLVPGGVMVAGNPWTGSALVWAVSDRPVAFPHIEAVWDEPRMLIAEELRDAATDPAVCEAVRELGVGYALVGGDPLWPDPRADTYPGLESLGSADGFEPVAREGDMTLYRITACGEPVLVG